MEVVFLVIGLLLGGFVGFFISKAVQKNYSTDEDFLKKFIPAELFKELQNQLDEKQNEILSLTQSLSQSREAAFQAEKRIEEHKAELQKIREQMQMEFQNLSGKLLEEKGRKMLELSEHRLGELLNPLKEKIQNFEKKVEETYKEETRERISLKEELKHIIKLNQQVSEDALKLTKALKGNQKIQGDWGEIQLEMILEKAGLEEGIHYQKQVSLKSETGENLRPDFIIKLPDNKNIILDAKVSLVAYERYFHSEDPNEQATFLKEHLRSLEQHIHSLSNKNYPLLHGINSPDYVLLFVPIEQALYLAIKEDARLYEKALEKNIVLVSTPTLLATLRTIHFIWKQENQKNNVFEIAKESGLLYDKFCGFLDDLKNLGIKLEGALSEYKGAMGKLYDSPQKGGTIMGRMEKIKKLGANATKSIPEAFLKRLEN